MHSSGNNFNNSSPTRKNQLYTGSKNGYQFLNSPGISSPVYTGSLNSLSNMNNRKIDNEFSNNSSKLFAPSTYQSSIKQNDFQSSSNREKDPDASLNLKKKLTATTFIHQPQPYYTHLGNTQIPTYNYTQHKTRKPSPSTTTHTPSSYLPLDDNSILRQSPKVQANRFYSTGSNLSSNNLKKSTSFKNPARPAIIESPQQTNLNLTNTIKLQKKSPKTFVTSSRSDLNNIDNEIDTKSKPKQTESNNPSPNSSLNTTSSIKKTLENIELKMRIIPSPTIKIADLFKCFLKNVPKSTETIESLVHYGDNIGAKIVKCLINENSFDGSNLINSNYDIYQGPALCVTYDAVLRDEHWDEIFVNNEEDASKLIQKKIPKNALNNQASKFMSFFHISDFIAILSGFKVAFVDPYERISNDEPSYVAIFDLENDTNGIDQFEDQFKPLEKIFNVPLLKNKYYNGTIIRLPLRTQNSNCSVSNKLVYVKDILVNAKDFMKEAHLHILFSKNISNIQFCRTKDNQNIEKIYSINVEESCMEHFKQKYKKINDAVVEGEFPRTSTIIITLRKQIETKIEKTEWILSIFADTMRLLNSNYFLMKLAIPISDNCDKDLRFSHKSNLISSDTGFIKTLYLTKPIICYIEDKEGILMSHFCRLNISDSLKLSHFNDAYALMLKDLTKIIRKDPALLWSLMPDLEKNSEFTELLGEIWQEIAKHELFYSSTEGWGYVAIEDMIINDVDDKSILQEILTKIYSETNYPVVIMPPHVLNALQKFSPKDSLQIMTPSQTSDILHNNVMLIEALRPNQKIELLRYLIKEPVVNTQNSWPGSAARYVLDLPLLLLSNQKFIKFQPPNKTKSVYLVEKDFLKLFNLTDQQSNMQYINPDLPKDILNIFKKFEFQRLTQLQMISDSELNELINVPKEWRSGEEKIQWSRNHEKYNLVWLETLWKYLNENFQNDLSMIENMNIIYTNPPHSTTLSLFKLSNNSNLVFTPSFLSTQSQDETITNELYENLIRIIKKLNFQCFDSIPDVILAHPLFSNYVPNLRKSRLGLLQAFRNKYRHASIVKIIQDFNALLNEADIKLIQRYLTKIEINLNVDSTNKELVEFLKFLPIFENSAVECMDKYIPIKECLYVYYDTQIRLPFELPGLKSFIYVDSLDTKILIQDKLGLNICKEFTFILKEIMKYLHNKDLNSLNSIKIHLLGKWLLLNCSTYLLGSSDLFELVKVTKLFLNQNQELCSPQQFINPGKNDKYISILDSKILPSKDLLQDEKCISVLKELKMRSYTQLKIDEIIDLYEQSIKIMTESHRRLLAELIIEILVNRYEQNETLLMEYSPSKAVNLRHYLTSVNWIPLKKDRPGSYPQSLSWKGADSASKFSSPKDCVDHSYSYCVGSVSYISDLDIPTQLKDFLDLKKVHLDQVVRHLKITTKCFDSSALKIEWYDYLTVTKKCYEFMMTSDPININRELKANDLNEWIWTGSGFSSISSVYLLNDKDHPLSSHLDTLPYELYPFLAFFESLGMKKTPDAKQLETIILKCVKNTHKLINSSKVMSKDQIVENAAKNYPLINFIKLNYPNESKLINNIKDYEESLISLSSSLNPFVSSQTSATISSSLLNDTSSNDLVYLYLPDIYKSVDIKDNLINSVMTLIKTKQFKILDEDAYLIKKSQHSPNLYDHYRVYNEIILPNLNNLSKNVKDSVVLFALDHADTKMLEILKDHPCIPVSPFGRRIKKPNKLIHPSGKLAPLYAESDERFPFGSEQGYIREDRLQILKILGMKCDQLTWQELIERAESVSKIREYDLAVERSIAILSILNEMLAGQDENSKKTSNMEEGDLEKIAECLKEISFIPVKQKPYQKLSLSWFGDKFKYRFAKPKELLSAQYELISSTLVAIPLNEYKKKENIITKSIENFLSIDDWSNKLTFKDVLKHLEQLSKTNISDLDDPKEVKLINDMVYQVYEYIQSECLKSPQLHEYIRLFFNDKKLILINDDFVLFSKVIQSLNFNLKPIYYQLPQQYLRSFKYLFSQVLAIKPDLDLNDLLTIIDVVKAKYEDSPITNKEEFNLILNVYALIIDHGYKSINNLFLPNINSVLMPGRLLYVHSVDNNKSDNLNDYVHPSIDRRVCLIAGCKFNDSNVLIPVEHRLFPKGFGNKRLEGVLTRLDDDRIDINLMSSLDEGNPQIVLEYLLECNRVHSLSQFLSDDDIFVLLKYFNDFLARNYQPAQFTRLRDLKIFKPLWTDKYINLQQSFTIYLINEDLFGLIKRTVLKQQQALNENVVILIKRSELVKLYSHLSLNNLNDVENFLNICLPLFPQIDAKTQNNFLKYLYEEILEKIYTHEKEKCLKILRERLFIQTRSAEQKLITDLYDLKSECLIHILNESYFPDEVFDSPMCIRFLKEAGLRTYLPSELCKKCMNEIETKVNDLGWTDELRLKSKYIYQHLAENWQRFDDSVLQQRFLEPHAPSLKFIQLKKPFEYDQFKNTCLKLSDGELQCYEHLIWTSSFILPKFVDTSSLDINTIEFLKINKKPCFALVNVHLTNICSESEAIDEKCLLETLSHIYKYLNELNITEADKDILKQLEDKDIVWSSTTRKFVSPNKICVNLDPVDECPPFLYSLTPELQEYKSLFIRLGAKDKPYAMLYGDILRKMAKVCANDYLNSNELCKALKAMEGFFKYLKLSTDTITSQFKLPGLYFVTTELKLEKSFNCVIVDNRDNLDDLSKLTSDKFVFNPGEKCFKMSTTDIKPLIDKIFISQRPTLFTQKYEATYDFTVPDDPDSQRQNLLTSLERKYQQIFTSRQLHRSLARCISNEEARRSSPKHLAIDEVEKVIRERLSSIKVTCVEYLETSLSYRKLSNQQKIEQTVEEKACYLTHESHQFATLYVSKKHIEQPYFSLCLARSLQPLLMDLHFDYSIFTSLIATSVSQMSRLLQLVNVATEENILSVIKLQYVPSSGKLYGDDVQLLAPYDPKLHSVLIGDLCVYQNEQGSYLYCQIVKILENEFQVLISDDPVQMANLNKNDLFVLENWHRIYDAMQAKPPDERETFKYSDNFSDTKKPNSSNQQTNNQSSNASDSNYEDSSNASDTSDNKSDTSSNYDSTENIPSSFEVEQAKNEVNNELRLLWSLEENERKKKINRLLLKWHPDKNTGKEKFASEVFKHLKKQIELYKNDPFLAGYNFRSAYSSYTPGYTSSSNPSYSSTSAGTGTGTGDDYRSRHYGSFENLNRKGSPGSNGGHSPHSSPSRDSGSTPGASSGFDYDAKGPGPSNLGRAGSFRQEWERRRQQKRQTGTGTDPRDRSSPSSARRRGADFTQMDATLWFTQAKSDLESANNDMHPLTGKPAYEWVCYKCYRAVEKALRAYHYFKGNGKLPASDIHGLLLGVDTNIRDIAFRFCNFIGNEANSMQYPGIARFGKTPNEVFPLTKAEQALDYSKELLKLVEDIIYSS
ncbi:unnamed protein product [Brachionus calyciflorus]|uniref:J domain-containing protein n=1 Tax=Brachionus calyciflorus TaxID=104777 RepID=A0A813NZM3_9BILA|nr:unnamed protein product [Brachionus calyciflorus]